MRRTSFAALLGALGAVVSLAGLDACNDASTPTPTRSTLRPDAGRDSGDDDDDDAGISDSGPPDVGPQTDSGCPEPKRITPDDLPTGYLAPEKVTLNSAVDGDTAHFKLQGRDVDVRFLFVNTEESKTADTTEFGIQTGRVVKKYLENAREIVVVRREKKSSPGQPDLDLFGRTLGLIFVDGDLFQTRLVREGWSAYYTEFGCANIPTPHESLLWAEAEARASERGIWQPEHPTDYKPVFDKWIKSSCRPNPFKGELYCK